MPINITNPSKAGGTGYGSPFVGPVNHTAQIALVLSGYSDDEIDADGYLKPGVPVAADGTLVGAAEPVFGVTIEPIKVATGNTAPEITAAGTQQIAVATHGQVNRDLIEDNLARALTADEIAGFALAGSHMVLL